MTNELPKELVNVAFDGGPDSAVGLCIAILPILGFALTLYLVIHGLIRRRRFGSAAPFPRLLVMTSSLCLAGEVLGLLWYAGYTLMAWGTLSPNGAYWTNYLVNFGDRLCWSSWMIPVVTIGYLGAHLLGRDANMPEQSNRECR